MKIFLGQQEFDNFVAFKPVTEIMRSPRSLVRSRNHKINLKFWVLVILYFRSTCEFKKWLNPGLFFFYFLFFTNKHHYNSYNTGHLMDNFLQLHCFLKRPKLNMHLNPRTRFSQDNYAQLYCFLKKTENKRKRCRGWTM